MTMKSHRLHFFLAGGLFAFGFLFTFVVIHSYWSIDGAFNSHQLDAEDVLGRTVDPTHTNPPETNSEEFSTLSSCLIERIPRLIHQTYKNTTIPQPWLQPYTSCRTSHQQQNWTFIFWTDANATDFIAAKYPWFLPTYLSYPYPIQRFDVIRYFILHHYGGIYLDLDVGCRRDLHPFLSFDVLLPHTHPVGVSNDVMMSVPGHPFFEQVIQNLESARRWSWMWMFKYPRVLFSTGSMFLTGQTLLYWNTMNSRPTSIAKSTEHTRATTIKGSHSQSCQRLGDLRIIPQSLYESGDFAFFDHYPGSSWHGGDARSLEWAWQRKIWILGSVLLMAVCIKVWLSLPKKRRLNTSIRGSDESLPWFSRPGRIFREGNMVSELGRA